MRTDDIRFRLHGPSIATNQNQYVRSWMLLLVDAAARNGISPISKLRLHRLVFLTNCLSPLYKIRSNDEQIVKYKRGPYYPVLQWHLDRLVGQSLLRILRIHHFEDQQGWWMDAEYSISRRGVDVIERLGQLEQVARLSDYLLEVAKAYASQSDDALDEVILGDLTYSDAKRALGAVIDFSFPADNLSTQAANSFSAFVRDPILVSAEDKVHLYVDYLDRIRAATKASS